MRRYRHGDIIARRRLSRLVHDGIAERDVHAARLAVAANPLVAGLVVGRIRRLCGHRLGDWAAQMVWWHAFQRQQVATRSKYLADEFDRRVRADEEVRRLRKLLDELAATAGELTLLTGVYLNAHYSGEAELPPTLALALKTADRLARQARAAAVAPGQDAPTPRS